MPKKLTTYIKSLLYIIFLCYMLKQIANKFDIYLTNNIINNAIELLIFIIILLPFSIKLIRKKIIFIIYIAILLICLPFIIFGELMVHGDLNNGWRLVYRKPFNNEKFLGIFRTPDLGALGGDSLAAAMVTPLLPGVVHRSVISTNLRNESQSVGNEPLQVIWQNNLWSVPSLKELYDLPVLDY
ncbi:MAG: hypothetical protein HQL98_02530 [Magnetococcales bacterium]|nr:hypothetical protein [Magnetococcales bacterium]